MEDPRHAVLAASRKKSGGELTEPRKDLVVDSNGDLVSLRKNLPASREAGDGADETHFREVVERKLSREREVVDGTASKSYHQGVVRLRSREVEGEGGEEGAPLSLVEKRKSQIEGSLSHQWNYADSFHSFRKDRVKVCL
jgi:hypothetical protein